MNLMESLLANKLAAKQSSGGSDLTPEVKTALLDCFANVAWAVEDGQQYYDALADALYGLQSITAVYTQSGTVYDTDSLDSLKADLVVAATYGDGSTQTVPAESYTLSGTLTEGTSTITAAYGGKTTTFDVTVTQHVPKSDMNGWEDGIAYTDLEIVKDSYWSASQKKIDSYAGWDRTGYVPCDGASSITFPAMPQTSGSVNSNGFFDSAKVWVSALVLERDKEKTVAVPSNAAYFMLSSNSSALASCVNSGIVPNA